MESKNTDNITRSSASTVRHGCRADTMLIGALLLIGVALMLYIRISSRTGSMLQVRIDGQTVAQYPMDEDIDIILTGKDGGTNRLIISDGQAWFSEASCPDHLCIGMGRIDKAGQSIICLPNRVSVEVMGGRDIPNAEGDDGDAQDKESTKQVEQSSGVDAVVGR